MGHAAPGHGTDGFSALLKAIVAADLALARDLLAQEPSLAHAKAAEGATRQMSTEHFIEEIGHYLYAGDTALHIAAAGYRHGIAAHLIAAGADVRARNRRGAEPLHYAADGAPDSQHWNPRAQAATIECLLAAGADANARDKSGVAPLHRAVRTRCAAAVKALLEGGAEADARNASGSTPMLLATSSTGRGGSGSARAKAEQESILRLLRAYLAR